MRCSARQCACTRAAAHPNKQGWPRASPTGPWTEAEEERQKAAGLVQQAYSGGYEHPIEVGGAVSTPLVLSPYGGWHGGCGNEEFVRLHVNYMYHISFIKKLYW